MNSKFKINKVKILNMYVYNLDSNTDCTICRCNLNTNSIYAQEKNIESITVSGMCNHSFHYECIKPWIKTSQNCPICSVKWEFKK
jgi:anaphase-promoting complex subunit 11